MKLARVAVFNVILQVLTCHIRISNSIISTCHITILLFRKCKVNCK